MKKLLATAAAAIAVAAFAAPAQATPGVTVVLAGGEEADSISISLSSQDGHSFVIEAAGSLEVGGSVCTHPEGMPNQLVCDSTKVSSFEVNAGGGDDAVTIGRTIGIPVTLRGGPGNDRLSGGGSVLGDRLIGGPGDDVLSGMGGPDALYGGPGDDTLVGGQGDDRLCGGPGNDKLLGGSGNDTLRGEAGEDVLFDSLGENVLVQ
ncbi:MAG TPA: calcium-binding protein [Solirubrobacterales bacterium]|nr:calcium-binding protein [Solirubrobacterales bacterium]